MNAKTFVEGLAQKLIDQGWDVKIERGEGKFVTDSVSFFATTGKWHDATISGSACKSAFTGRWNFTGVRVYRFGSDVAKNQTYRAARVAVDVYARNVRQAVSA
jgi:hypothetical protein